MIYLIRNGLTVQPHGVEQADILIAGGKIQQIAPELKPEGLPYHSRVIDAGGCYVLPGIIDAHTHYHLESRGAVTADGFIEGSRAGAFGGVTTIIDFADHAEGMTLAESSARRTEAMADQMVLDFALHQGVYRMHDGIPAELEELISQGVSAVKIFTTYKDAGYLLEDQRLEQLFAACAQQQVLVTVHAEDDSLIEETGLPFAGKECPPAMHPVLRPAEAEARAVEKITRLARQAGMPIYIVHLSSKAGLEAILQARIRGTRVIAETAPHYLILDEGYLKLNDAELYLMTPPLRSIEDSNALWDGVLRGEITVAATDHCAFTPEQKHASRDCRTILPGIPGSEELLVLMHTFGVKQRKMGIAQLVQLLSRNPAQQFGLYPKKGCLAPGSDADLVIFDPETHWTITNDNRHSAAGYSPYAGMDVQGQVRLTMRRGEVLIEENEYFGEPGSGVFQSTGIPAAYR